MPTRDTIGFVLAPLVLLVTAWMVNAFRLWDSIGNYSLPWLCTTIAFAVLIVGATSLLMGCPPTAIPPRRAAAVVVGLLVIFGISLIVDGLAYPTAGDWPAAVGGWLGLGVIQTAAFWLARTGRASNAGAPNNHP